MRRLMCSCFRARPTLSGWFCSRRLASGLPVAAFPVTGPRDVIGAAPVGALNDDLRLACLSALAISPQACLAFAAAHTWEASARAFRRKHRQCPRADAEGDAVPFAAEHPQLVA